MGIEPWTSQKRSCTVTGCAMQPSMTPRHSFHHTDSQTHTAGKCHHTFCVTLSAYPRENNSHLHLSLTLVRIQMLSSPVSAIVLCSFLRVLQQQWSIVRTCILGLHPEHIQPSATTLIAPSMNPKISVQDLRLATCTA